MTQETLTYDEVRKKIRKASLPSRRELHSEPWDEEQFRMFCLRQRHVPEIWARMGVRIVRSLYLVSPDGTYEEEKR